MKRENDCYLILDPNKQRAEFSEQGNHLSPFDIGIPLLDLSNRTIQQIYYFRWHTYCKHLKQTPVGWVVTEFLPDVPWAGKYNTICCPAGHHFYEGRWLHDPTYLNDYARFWFSEEGEPRKYSFWAADAIYAFCKIQGDFSLAASLIGDLIANYKAWEKEKQTDKGLFWQIDDRDGMEYSIGGSGYRPTINSYMYGDAIAISEIAEMSGQNEIAKRFRKKAEKLKNKINEFLWNSAASFYQTRSMEVGEPFANVREEIGYVPWYFDIPENDRAVAWTYLNDPRYFSAPYGPTTAEQNHPDFMKWFRHECLWNGPSWPFATSQTLTALGNLLCDYEQNVMAPADYFNLLETYAGSHYIRSENGDKIPFIDEDLDPYTGEWIARRILQSAEPKRKDAERGKDYNHSTFCDLVISGLAGIRSGKGDQLIIHPLFSEDQLDFLCLDGIRYHGHSISVLWDKTGNRYQRGMGLRVFCDRKEVAVSAVLSELKISLTSIQNL